MDGFTIIVILFIVFYCCIGIGTYLKFLSGPFLYFVLILPAQTLYVTVQIIEKLMSDNGVCKRKNKSRKHYKIALLFVCLHCMPTFSGTIAGDYISRRSKKIMHPLKHAKNECATFISQELVCNYQ
jgi:hypothetical protein